MANCAIYIKGSDEITYFIRDCIQDGRNFRGANGQSVTGVKEYLFDVKWTDDIADPNMILKEITPCRFVSVQDGWKTPVSALSDSLRYMDQVVSNREDVDTVTKAKIRERYSREDELKLHRLRDVMIDEWKEYAQYVEELRLQGKAFRDKYFPK